jgi:4-hydroxy-tetrahydrodipicolinate synthase
MDLYSGDDNLNIPILAIGGTASISVASNIAPKQVKQVADLVLSCKLKEANEIQDRILPLIDACFCEVNPIPAKAGCNMIGLDAGIPRAPLTELEDEHKQIMKESIIRAGIKI